VTILRSVYLGFSNENTSLKFLQKNLLCYGVRHYRVNLLGGTATAYFAKASKWGINRKNQDKN
jgi:hypothetical protein